MDLKLKLYFISLIYNLFDVCNISEQPKWFKSGPFSPETDADLHSVSLLHFQNPGTDIYYEIKTLLIIKGMQGWCIHVLQTTIFKIC